MPVPARIVVLAFAVCALAACSSGAEPDAPSNGAVERFELPEHDAAALSAERAVSDAMPGTIDPPDAVWRATGKGAAYGEAGRPALIELACTDGDVTVARQVPSDKGAKALLAFVGYRGILRLKVASDGKTWRGRLRADDPHWIAVTGGPFYATVAGGGKVISPASSVASGVVTRCEARAKAERAAAEAAA